MFFDLIHVSRYTHIRDPGFPRRLYLYLLGEVSMGDSGSDDGSLIIGCDLLRINMSDLPKRIAPASRTRRKTEKGIYVVDQFEPYSFYITNMRLISLTSDL